MLVQQAMQQSYARQTGVLPPAAGAQQQGGAAAAAGQHAPNTRVKWGVEANDDDFEEVIAQEDVLDRTKTDFSVAQSP